MSNAYRLITANVESFTSGLYTSPIRVTKDTSFPIVQYSDFRTSGLGFFRSSAIAVGGVFGEGRYVAFAHEGFFAGESDGQNDTGILRKNVLSWLGDGFVRKRIGFTAGHQEWLTIDNFSDELKTWCREQNIVLEEAAGEDLSSYDMLILGNSWGAFSGEEVEALAAYVNKGGGLLVLSLGWSWANQQGDVDCANLPANALGGKLGFHFENGIRQGTYVISGAKQEFAVVEAGRKANFILSRQLTGKKTAVYALEGKRVILHLPAELWKKVKYPKDVIEALDAFYEKEAEFVGYINPPYKSKLWFIVNDSSVNFMYMDFDHCGMSIEGAKYFVDTLVRDDGRKKIMPNWGYGHEVGHAMVNHVCGGLFQPWGTNEAWNNVINIYAYKENGYYDYAKEFAARFPGDYSGNGGQYLHLQGDYDLLPAQDRQFEVLRANPWLFLKLPMLIIDNYGWEGMAAFFRTAARDTAMGMKLTTDEEKTAYMIVNLSRAYNRDFSPLFLHWRFTVTDTVKEQLAVLPAEEIIMRGVYE